MIERQELHCHNCGRYVQFNLDTDLNGKHVLNCPNCGHEHCRFVNKGVVSDTRWDSRTTKPTNITGYIYEAKKFLPNFFKNLFNKVKDPFRGLQISIIKDSNGISQIHLSRKKTSAVYANQFAGIQLPPWIVNPTPNAPVPVYHVTNIQCTTTSTFITYQGTVGQGTGGNTFMYQAWMNTTIGS